MKKKYALPRRTEILYEYAAEADSAPEEEIPGYPVHVFLSPGGLFEEDHAPVAAHERRAEV